MPTDIQNTTFPLADTVRNMDNMPYSKGLNGLPNNTTDAGATLGRVLFYDVDLSKNRTLSCASCHKQEFGFTDSAQFSTGFIGGKTGRNSMSLIHTRFDKAIVMFWDGRAADVETQVTMPIRDAVEMGMTAANTNGKQWDTISARVSKKSFYAPLFQAAFGSTKIDSQRIALALAQFVRSMNSYDSKWRRAINGFRGNPSTAIIPGLTSQELLGRDLFMDVNRGNCQACHTRNIFVPQGAQNNGVDGSITEGNRWKWTAWSTRDDYKLKDSGFAGVKARGNYSGVLGRDSNAVKSNIGRMKVPSLMNIGVTAPYMHDGRFKTLDDVINFYSDSIKNNDYNTLSLFLRKIDPRAPGAPNNVTSQLAIDTAPVRILHYTTAEKAALKAFLLTLTDSTFLKDPKFSNPFCVTSTTARTSQTESQTLKQILSLNTTSSPMGLFVNAISGQNFLGTISIYTIDGKLILQKNNVFGMGTNDITFPALSSGEYVVTVEAHNSVVYSKQIII
jgi:cytochrome c peroxidase